MIFFQNIRPSRKLSASGLARVFSSPQGKKRRNNLFIASIFDAVEAKKGRQDTVI